MRRKVEANDICILQHPRGIQLLAIVGHQDGAKQLIVDLLGRRCVKGGEKKRGSQTLMPLAHRLIWGGRAGSRIRACDRRRGLREHSAIRWSNSSTARGCASCGCATAASVGASSSVAMPPRAARVACSSSQKGTELGARIQWLG